MTPEELDVIRARHVAASPGPWHWSGQNDSYNGPYLATWIPGEGRTIIMDFVRLGMWSAQPRFNIDGAMVKAVPDLVVQEVDYRKDVESIDHPDAEFIVHSHADVAFLLAYVDAIETERDRWANDLRYVLAWHDDQTLAELSADPEGDRIRKNIQAFNERP